MRLVLLLLLAGCPTENPYKNVAPKKVKQDVEKIQQQEDEKNDKRLEQMK